jgi:hypothetical protein
MPSSCHLGRSVFDQTGQEPGLVFCGVHRLKTHLMLYPLLMAQVVSHRATARPANMASVDTTACHSHAPSDIGARQRRRQSFSVA